MTTFLTRLLAFAAAMLLTLVTFQQAASIPLEVETSTAQIL